MTLPQSGSDPLLSVYLTLSQYPVLSARIRELMRQKLYREGFLEPHAFQLEVSQKAMQTQEMEGIQQPLLQEDAETWEYRRSLVMNQLTDYYFANAFAYDHLSELIQQALTERGVNAADVLMEFNPETAPMELLFNQGMMIEKLQPSEQQSFGARLHEIKVVLIRKMISDQLPYINIAKDWFTIADLAEIRRHKLGMGRVGGKAAGMLLAARILTERASPALLASLKTPVSFYIGSDVFYNFISVNNLLHWNEQKYKSEDQMRAEYPDLLREFEQGDFPPTVLQSLETILSMANRRPLIVRSSSLLEDNFGTAFAGKYDSIFLPNQGKPEENLIALKLAMARIYASTLNPAAMVYRKSRGLLDYDERMALLIQVVEGEANGRFYFPQMAGVAYSLNLYRWSPQIRPEDGFIRLVWGLGTRAVDRVGNDYPQLIALSHPTLHPSSSAKSIRRYSQQFIDLIDLQGNQFCTLPVREVLNAQTPQLRFIAQLDSEGFLSSLTSNILDGRPEDLVITFDGVMKQTSFPQLMREMLQTLQKEYSSPVDVEFTAQLKRDPDGSYRPEITLIQCRPLPIIREGFNVLPGHVEAQDKIFSATSLVAGGTIQKIEYVLYVPPTAYFSISVPAERHQLERAIGRLNAALSGKTFISIGPGRWGTSNPDLGIHVDYADIFNSKALVEIAGIVAGVATEPSLGTHFFQDLIEGNIYPLTIQNGQDLFAEAFFNDTPNRLSEWIKADEALQQRLRLICVADFRPGSELQIFMDQESSRALAFFGGGPAAN